MKVKIKPIQKVIENQPKPSNLKIINLLKNYESYFYKNFPKSQSIVHEKGELYEYQQFLPQQLCEDLIQITENEGYADAPIAAGVGKGFMNKNFRNSERVMFDDKESANFLYKYIKNLAPLCSEGAYLYSVNERFRFLKYQKGGKFKKHCDGRYSESPRIQSMYTIQFYLNDVEKGGGTSFYYSKFNNENQLEKVQKLVKSVEGNLAIFRQNGLLHMGDEVEKGLKYTIRNEIMYKYLNNEEIQNIQQKQCNQCQQEVQIIPYDNCNHFYVQCGCPPYYSLGKQNQQKKECKVCLEDNLNLK